MKNKISLFLLIVLFFGISCTISTKPADSYIVMKPYLQNVKQNSITVMVESNTSDSVHVYYGNTESMKLRAATSYFKKAGNKIQNTYVHRIILKGLQPGTRYYYRAIQNNDTSDMASFVTAVGSGKPFRFAAFGDNRSQPKIFSEIVRAVADKNPMFSIYTGDLCHDESYNSWKNEFFTPDHLNLIANVPFFNAVGNHESWAQNTIAFEENSADPSEERAYYSFDYGDAHFLILSNEHKIIRNSRQYNFAEKDLKNSNKPWKIVAFHKPAYCGGGHGEDINMIRVSKEIFEPNHVNLVLNGHSHFYQKNLVNGIYHLVLAGAGAPLYNPVNKPYTVKSVKAHHFAIFDVSPQKLKMTVYGLNGKIIDTLELDREVVPTIK